MTFLLSDVGVFLFASLVCYGSVRCYTLKDSELKALEKGPPVADNDPNSCPAMNSKYPVLLPHPEDCGKFYICDSGIRHLKECQTGLHFNPKIKACDFPYRAGCESGNQVKPKGRIVGDTLNPCPAENPEYPVMLPHSEDCSKFYVCDSGNLILRECSLGLHFNTKIKACDYPDNAGCDAENSENPKGKTTGDDVKMCPAKNPSHPVMFPHPDDCSQYYVCDNGEALLRQCHPGLHFHAKIKACDYPERAECDADFKGGIKLESDLLDQDDICPAQVNGRPDFIPHHADCGKFFVCSGGSKFPFTCPTGLHFNPTMETCDFPENTECIENFNGVLINSKDKTFENEISEQCRENRQPLLVPHPNDCNKYYSCDHGEVTLRQCPPGLNFDEELQVCDIADNKNCEKHMSNYIAGVPSPFCPSRNGRTPIFYRHPTNCSVYYMCGNGLAYEFVCPARLHFNVRKKVCDYEINAGCQKSN